MCACCTGDDVMVVVVNVCGLTHATNLKLACRQLIGQKTVCVRLFTTRIHTHTHCRCVSVQYIELVFSILTKTYWYCAVISLFVMWLSRWYYSERLLLKFVYLFLSLSFPKESQRPWQPSPSHVVWVSLTADETPLLLLLLFSWNLYFGKASFYCLSGFSIFFSFQLLFFSFKNIVLFVWQIHSPPKTISCVVQFVLKFAQ